LKSIHHLTMKKNLLFAAAFAACSIAKATDVPANDFQPVRLVVREVSHEGANVPGHTYRVYAQLPSSQYSLQVVYGDAAHPLRIESSAPFFQSPFAGASAAGVSSAALQADAHLVQAFGPGFVALLSGIKQLEWQRYQQAEDKLVFQRNEYFSRT
jgi:hypothetical protein